MKGDGALTRMDNLADPNRPRMAELLRMMEPGGANLVGMIQADPISIGTTAIGEDHRSSVVVEFVNGSQADTFAQWLLTHYPDAEDLILPF